MYPRQSVPGAAPVSARFFPFLAALLIAVAALLAYRNTFHVPFFFDDTATVLENESIRSLWPLPGPLAPPPTAGGACGRPVVNLSLALNHAFGGFNVVGYHAFNLGVHILTGLLLFGLVRRTLEAVEGWSKPAILPVAFVTALLWTLHPLQTESVTCVAQRTELLLGLFYLLTFAGAVRAFEENRPGRWHFAAWLACLAGMATKEVMVSAPLMILLYDRTFIAGTFRKAWNDHRRLYLGLASTWLLLAFLVVSSEGRGGVAGTGFGVSWWSYLLKQCEAVVLYLKLSFWPHPLVLDYGTEVVQRFGTVAPQFFLLVVLAAGTGFALWRKPVVGFVGAWFFVILAPSSSVLPLVSQTVAEHRMYLPLVVPVLAVVLGLHALAGRMGLVVLTVIAAALGVVTFQRNADYGSALTIWADTVKKWPANGRAHSNLGHELQQLGRLNEAAIEYAEAVRLYPDFADARHNYGTLLMQLERGGEALVQFKAALRINPELIETRNNFAACLTMSGRTEEAVQEFQEILRRQPRNVSAFFNLGKIYADLGRVSEAVASYGEVLRLNPDHADAHFLLGELLQKTDRWAEALPHFEALLKTNPESADVHENLGVCFALTGRLAEAVAQFETVLGLEPEREGVRLSLAKVLIYLQRRPEAAARYREVLRLDPGNVQASEGLSALEPAR